MPMTPVAPHRAPPLPLPDTGARTPAPLRAGGGGAERGLRGAGQQITRSTREHPQAACGLAFVAGLVIARAIRRLA